ncbi:related to amidases [Fusarium fujikuroi]|nr:related to amidases [Fusarium fujikuroi]
MLTSNLIQAVASTFIWTSGALNSPAQKSAVISIKPTVGLPSRHGAHLVSEWQDTVGVLARTVQDAATVLIAIAGTDPNDPFTISDPRDDSNTRKLGQDTNFAHACTKSGLEGKGIAACSPRIPRHLFPNDEVVVTALDKALPIMRAQGDTIVDNVRFSEFNSNYTSSEDIDWTFGLRVSIHEKNPEERPDDWGMDEWLKCEELDLNVGGCPTIGVPLGYYPKDHPIAHRKSSGLATTGPNVPFGGLFIGRRWADSNLIAAAHAFEQACLIRDQVPPIVSSDIQLPLHKAEKIGESL